MWTGLNLSPTGSNESSEENKNELPQKLLNDGTELSAPSSKLSAIPEVHTQLTESSLPTRGAITSSPSMLCERLKEKWLGNSTRNLSFCDRIRIHLGVRIASLFSVSGEAAVMQLALLAGIWIYSFRVEASPHQSLPQKEFSVPQSSDYLNSTPYRGFQRR